MVFLEKRFFVSNWPAPSSLHSRSFFAHCRLLAPASSFHQTEEAGLWLQTGGPHLRPSPKVHQLPLISLH